MLMKRQLTMIHGVITVMFHIEVVQEHEFIEPQFGLQGMMFLPMLGKSACLHELEYPRRG